MRCVIVTGMSGAGKSTALKMLEDVGYFCVDNLPVPLIPKMADLLRVPGTELNKAALGVDIRSGQSLEEMAEVLDPGRLREEEQITRRLREIGEACMRRGERDNLSAVYVKVTDR